MRTHTEGFKENIKKIGRQIRSKIIFTIDNVETILVDEDINSVSLSTKTSLLKSVMKELQIDINQDIPLGTILEYQFGLKVGEEYEYITYGNFIVNKVEKQEDTRSWVITCYDKMLYAMTKYEGLYLQYPVTIRDYINALCTNIGLEFKNASDEFCNYDKSVNEDLFVNQNVTYRDVLDQLAEVTGSNICISNDDKLELRYINQTLNRTPQVIKKQALSTPTSDTNFWDYSTYTTPLTNGWCKIERDNTSGTSNTWTNNYIKLAGVDLEPNTQYTIIFEWRNASNVSACNLSQINQNSNPFIENVNLTNLATSGTYKTLVTTKSTFASNCLGFRNFYTTPARKNMSLEARVMIVKGDYTNKDIDFEYYYEEEGIDEEYLKDINVKFGEKFGPVNSIVLSRAADSDRIFNSDEESIALNGLTEIKISENQFMNFNDRDQYLPDLLEQLDGLEFYINDYSSTGLMYYELGDLYNVKIGNNTYKTLMLNDVIEVKDGLQESVYLDHPEKSDTDYTKTDKTDNRINQTYLIVNKQTGEIQALTNRVEVVENSTTDTYTKEQINELVQTAVDGLTNKFTTKGGNNLLRNTGLWFENDDRDDAVNNPYEFWTGKVERISEDKAVNMNALLLKDDTLSQQVEVRNDTYTLSFKYKKLISLADCKLVVNDIEIPLTEEDDKEVVQQIEASSRNISVQFITDTDDSCEVYDLMLNIGDSKSEYSQNENETTTDTVNIGKGITITSTDTETVFKANSDGIRIYDDKDLTNPRTNFTAKGTETDYIEVKNEANIIGLYHKKVGNHIWVTKL